MGTGRGEEEDALLPRLPKTPPPLLTQACIPKPLFPPGSVAQKTTWTFLSLQRARREFGVTAPVVTLCDIVPIPGRRSQVTIAVSAVLEPQRARNTPLLGHHDHPRHDVTYLVTVRL
jgi:hypothetical protein